MKLFHKEGWKRVVYVQRQDIAYLTTETKLQVPASIYAKVTLPSKSNCLEFVKFEQKDEVEFFKGLDFIIDYDQYKDLTEDELREKIKCIGVEMNEIAQRWNLMRPNERMYNRNLLEERRNKQYMIKVVSEIYDIKCGKISISFPELEKKPKKKK